MLIPFLIAAIAGYLLGSLPFGYLVARTKGVNIFEVGSKSPGATNVKRVLGSGPGNLVFFLDALKGAAAVALPMLAYRLVGGAPDSDFSSSSVSRSLAAVGLVGALLGHSFSCFTKFRGGKGVATAAGGLLVLMPIEIVVGAVVWVATFYGSRYVSLASILAALALLAAAFFIHEPRLLQGLALFITVFVLLRHRANIVRLLNGNENKFVKKQPPS